jgi:hypothetical protein
LIREIIIFRPIAILCESRWKSIEVGENKSESDNEPKKESIWELEGGKDCVRKLEMTAGA